MLSPTPKSSSAGGRRCERVRLPHAVRAYCTHKRVFSTLGGSRKVALSVRACFTHVFAHALMRARFHALSGADVSSAASQVMMWRGPRSEIWPRDSPSNIAVLGAFIPLAGMGREWPAPQATVIKGDGELGKQRHSYGELQELSDNAGGFRARGAGRG